MKKPGIYAAITAIQGFCSIIAVAPRHMPLSDIAKEPDTVVELKFLQFSWIHPLLFIIFAFFVPGYLLKNPGLVFDEDKQQVTV